MDTSARSAGSQESGKQTALIAGAAFFRFLLSSGGLLVSLFALGVWAIARPRSRIARRTFLLVGVAYLLASCYPLPHVVAGWLAAPYQPLTNADRSQRTVVVLLGSGGYTQRNWSNETFSVLDAEGAARTLEAARVFRLLDAAWIISSGGRVDLDDPDEPSATLMKDALIQLGVPAERIVIEKTSRTTQDEARIVRDLLPALNATRVVLVTSAVHMRRSLGAFGASGIDAIPAIAKSSPHVSDSPLLRLLPSRTGLDETDAVVHELLGLGYYWVRGWLK